MMNRKLLLSLSLSGGLLLAVAQKPAVVTAPAIPADPKIEQNIEKLLKKMTLEEKIGQMTQLAVDMITKEGSDGSNGFEFNEAMLDSVISKYKVGSILNVPYGSARTNEVWTALITRLQEKSIKEIGIPCIYGVDQIHGATYTDGSTFFPQGINMAATFNRALVREGSQISSYETKAGNIPWTFAPVIDLGRDPRWPRQWENYGEDSYVNAEMGRESVLGFQGNDPNHIGKNSIAACLKHYMGYGVPISGKDRTPSSITEQDMREKHFAPFLESVRSGALSVMVNSAMNNGLPFHANYELLTQWLKKDLNWDGMIITDWGDINNLYNRDKVASSKKEAVKMAINAGIDMSMVANDWNFCIYLKELVKEGGVSMSRIDDAVRRILRLKYRLGLFEKPFWKVSDYPEFASKKYADCALAAAEESMVLLKNTDKILPLAAGKKMLVTGPNANSMRTLNGGWSYSWQGEKADQFAGEYHTILEALTQKYGADKVVYEPGVTYKPDGAFWEEYNPEIEKAVAAAAGVDYIIACIGENSYCETVGNLVDLRLSDNQLRLVKALAKTGKPIVLVLNEGRPRIISEIEPLVKAVVHTMLPGNYGGDALANLMIGDANFSGKMPYTYPKEVHSLATYDYKPCENTGKMLGAYDYDAVMNVQWEFGCGQSYTSFAYSNLKVNKSAFTANDELVFMVDVKNTGSRAGKESVLLFASDLVASLSPDNRRLRAFEKVELQPGETKTAMLKVKGSDFAFVGYDGKWVLEKGDFRIQVGDQLMKIVCSTTKKWSTPNK